MAKLKAKHPKPVPTKRHPKLIPFGETRKISSDLCISTMKSLGPVSGELISLLNLPKELYESGDGFSRISFSSQSDTTADDLARFLIQRPIDSQFPQVPDYGLLLTTRGSNSLCVLVDKRRKVIVFQNVKNIYTETGSWDSFCNQLKEALDEAKRSKSGGLPFDFIVRGEQKLVI